MQKKDARILVAGSYGHGNTGDEAILAVIVDQLRARMPDVRLVVVAGDTEATGRRAGVETVPWDDWAAIAQALQTADMVIQGGGGIFFDYATFQPWDLFENGASDLAHYGGFSLLAKLYNKPFMIYSVGVGPILTDSGRQMIKVAHSLADMITVRDDESKLLLEAIGLESKRIEVTADPAFSLRPSDESRAQRILIDHGIDLSRTVIAVAPRAWNHRISQSEWESSLADAVSEFAIAGQAQVLLIPFQKGYDDSTILRIQHLLASSNTTVLRSEYTPQEIAGVIGNCDLLIGMRLHSVLFAILTATPVVALSYDSKVRSLTRRIGHEDICIDLSDLSQLKNLLATVWEQRQELSSDFTKARAELGLLSETNADLACELLNTHVPQFDSGSEARDMLASAFYGRLQAIRSANRAIANQDGAKELREIIGIMEHGSQPSLLRTADSGNALSLQEELQSFVSEAGEHLVLIYHGTALEGGPDSLAGAFAECGTSVVSVCDVHLSNSIEGGGKLFHLPVAAMVGSWDEVLSVSAPQTSVRILLLRTADQNSFRLINHAHTRGWLTIYFPVQPASLASQDSQAEEYVVSNVDYVIADSESLKNDIHASAARAVSIIADSNNTTNQVSQILALVAEALPKSPVRLAIKGASYG